MALQRGTVKPQGYPTFFKALQSGDRDAMQHALSVLSDPNAFVDEECLNFPLTLASVLPNGADQKTKDFALWVLEELLGLGADPNQRDKPYQRTPIFTAVQTGFPEAVEALVRGGADINARDYRGWTPLFLASTDVREQEMIRVLSRLGADPAITTNRGGTAMEVLRGSERLHLLVESR